MPKGKHPEKALNAKRVQNLSEPGRYADGNGLYLIVDPSGAKRWVLRTVVRGRRRDMGLGSLKTVSLADAKQSTVCAGPCLSAAFPAMAGLSVLAWLTRAFELDRGQAERDPLAEQNT